jgi:hypothetical protein
LEERGDCKRAYTIYVYGEMLPANDRRRKKISSKHGQGLSVSEKLLSFPARNLLKNIPRPSLASFRV